jgi:cell shape-determining protein MreD
MLLDVINIEKVRRVIIYLLVLMLTFFVQEVILSRVIILGVRPMIIPITIVAVGFWNGGVWGGVFGLIAGVFTDMSFLSSSVLMTVLFPVIGFFSGALPLYLMSRRLGSFIILSVCALALTGVMQMLGYLLFSGTAIIPLLMTALFQTLWSVPFIFLIYFPCRKLSGVRLKK